MFQSLSLIIFSHGIISIMCIIILNNKMSGHIEMWLLSVILQSCCFMHPASVLQWKQQVLVVIFSQIFRIDLFINITTCGFFTCDIFIPVSSLPATVEKCK